MPAFINDKGVSTSTIVRKLGTLKELLEEHGPTRDDVMAWAREEARIETEKYKFKYDINAILSDMIFLFLYTNAMS